MVRFGAIFCILTNAMSTFDSAGNAKTQLLRDNFSAEIRELGIGDWLWQPEYVQIVPSWMIFKSSSLSHMSLLEADMQVSTADLAVD